MLVNREAADDFFNAVFDLPKYYLSLNSPCEIVSKKRG